MGGKHLVVDCKLLKNGYGVTSRALVDSGANGFVFIDSLFAVDLAKFLNISAQRLPFSIKVKGYDGRPGKPVTHYLRLNLSVDNRQFFNLPILILGLRTYNMILRRKWLAFFDILVNCRRRGLV